MIGGLLLIAGYLLMAWALAALGHNYQLGEVHLELKNRMVVNGPYGWIRHPMYSAALSIALGLTCLIQSWVLFGVFCIYLVLLTPLIPAEENKLRSAYPEQYSAYQQQTRRLIPFIF
ncbi:MAG: isoprenylcysteine carboxylmethyltransferase family protein [Anaerolineae bacterium]